MKEKTLSDSLSSTSGASRPARTSGAMTLSCPSAQTGRWRRRYILSERRRSWRYLLRAQHWRGGGNADVRREQIWLHFGLRNVWVDHKISLSSIKMESRFYMQYSGGSVRTGVKQPPPLHFDRLGQCFFYPIFVSECFQIRLTDRMREHLKR